LLVFGALLTACGGDDGGSEPGAQNPADLEGDPWVLTQMLDADGNTQIVDVGVIAQFDGSTMSGISGCNDYNATYEATGDQISFGPIAYEEDLPTQRAGRRGSVPPAPRRGGEVRSRGPLDVHERCGGHAGPAVQPRLSLS